MTDNTDYAKKLKQIDTWTKENKVLDNYREKIIKFVEEHPEIYPTNEEILNAIMNLPKDKPRPSAYELFMNIVIKKYEKLPGRP